jgi:GT2 family glycosyltransferase/glycosyltransferase involved in cell wall biosynthesis
MNVLFEEVGDVSAEATPGPDQRPAKRTCILVLGMHRSGTSALTRVLSLLGAALPRHVMGAGDGNAAGHWEPARLVAFHDRMLGELDSAWHDWRPLDLETFAPERIRGIKAEIRQIVAEEFDEEPLFIIKDPRICRFAQIFMEALEGAGIGVVPVITLRNPLEVSASLQKREAMWPTGYSEADAALLWLTHVLEAEIATRGRDRVIVTYDDLMSDWRKVASVITEYAGIEFTIEEDKAAPVIDGFLDNNLRRHAHAADEVPLDPVSRGWVNEAFQAMMALSANPACVEAQAVIDRLDSDLRRTEPILYNLIEAARHSQEAAQAVAITAKVKSESERARFAKTERNFRERLQTLEGSLSEANGVAREKEATAKGSKAKVDSLTRQICEALGVSEMEAQNIPALIAANMEELTRRNAALTRAEAAEKHYRSQIESTQLEMAATLAEHAEQIAGLERNLTKRDHELARAYRDYDDTVHAFRSSTSWRLTAPLRAMKASPWDIRQSVSTVSTAMKISGGVWLGITRGFRILGREGPSGIFNRLAFIGNNPTLFRARGVQRSARRVPAERRRFNSLRFEMQPDPEVSIIVPVYNQLDYTIGCLQSLMDLDTPYAFEVIVMDDGSTDDTETALSDVPGLRYVRNETNLGFLRNCNKGASLARGRYLAFLNNDTELDSNWLTALRRTFDEHEKVGLVGSKLVYPDGRLQEAGGIVWEDASAWNWGRFKDPAHPAYNYVRDVDYVSGASIMVERDFFERLNRFDERYENAYYEDTDLAMSVRAAGLRVLYQPASVVVHHEGVSSGVDETAGVKLYQSTNRENFLDKWKQTLEANLPNGETPQIASDRRVNGHVLIIDACTPTPDQDSGSVDMFNLIRILRDEGYRVHLIPQSNFLHFGSYSDVLQSLGVECVYAPFYSTVEEYLAERGDMFDHVMLTRVNVAHDSIATVKRYCPSARLLFYTVDLHGLRERREAELSGNRAKMAAAERTEKLELALMDEVDTTIVLSEAEQAHLRDLGKRNVVVLPLIRDLPEPRQVPFGVRKGVLFIGGYQHKPNIDAVDWLVGEIWPEVRRIVAERRLDPIPLHLYGSEMPLRFNDYAADDIRVHGFIDDLGMAFSKVRLSVAPLRYGAGLKGKLATSFGFGVPAVGTDIAFEGIANPVFSDLQVPVDAPKALARRLVDLHEDESALWDLSDCVRRYAQEHYSVDAIAARLREILQHSRV